MAEKVRGRFILPPTFDEPVYQWVRTGCRMAELVTYTANM